MTMHQTKYSNLGKRDPESRMFAKEGSRVDFRNKGIIATRR